MSSVRRCRPYRARRSTHCQQLRDVSIMDLDSALAGAPVVEIAHRIPIQAGPFGIAASPDGKLVAVTSRQNNIAGIEGNTISLIDVDRARQGLPGAEAARVRVGADQPDQPTRPFSVAWTLDGRVVVANFRTNSVSVVDVPAALVGQGGAEVARSRGPRRARVGSGCVLAGGRPRSECHCGKTHAAPVCNRPARQRCGRADAHGNKAEPGQTLPRIGAAICDPLAASLMRVAAARHFEHAAELKNAGANPSIGPTAMEE
jgi:hypothetical protein